MTSGDLAKVKVRQHPVHHSPTTHLSLPKLQHLVLVAVVSSGAAVVAPRAPPPPPPQPSPRRHSPPPPLHVAPGGALLLAGGSLALSSTFSEGAHVHTFNVTRVPSSGRGWAVSTARQGDYSVSVVGKAASFTVRRVYTLAAGSRVMVNDTITAVDAIPSVGVVGIQVRHRVWSPLQLPITGVTGPNTLRASSCATTGITGELHSVPKYGSTVGLDAGTGGNPSVYGVFGTGRVAVGVGLLALDDVFVAHSETANRAGQVDAFTNTAACQALRSNPASIELADPHFGLPVGDSHTLEWVVYTVQPAGATSGLRGPAPPFSHQHQAAVVPPGYWQFINTVRQDSGVSGSVTIPKLGPMGAFQAGLLRTDNYTTVDWTKWTDAEMRSIIKRNGIGHIISQMPRAQFDSPCGLNPTVATGSGFVNENTSKWDSYFKLLVAKVSVASAGASDRVRVLIYFHAFISGEREAGLKYPLDRVLNYEGQQLNYSGCEAMPLFYPMLLPNGTANAYGQQLHKYLEKAKGLGASGICAWALLLALSPS